MSRIILIHWNAVEGEARAAHLGKAGHEVSSVRPQGRESLRDLRHHPPDLFVIDLNRLPSEGRAVGVFLRQQKGTRLVPVVFVGGDEEKVAKTRRLLPDAHYTDWSRIRGTVRRAVRRPLDKPVVPGTMAGYSGTPLTKKLGIKAGAVVALLGAPAGFERLISPLPEGARVVRQARTPAQLSLLFTRSRADLEQRLATAATRITPGVGLWINWPKQASGVTTDLTERIVRASGLRAGLVDYKICAIDETWSGLLFTRRRTDSGRAKRRSS